MLKKLIKIVAILLGIILVGIQFFRIDKTDPPIDPGETLEAAVTVPPDISLIIGRACNDCHTHKTVYPWYTNVQPFGWFVKDHVVQGREELNLSRFNTLDKKKKKRKLEEICDEVSSGSMPLPSYLWIHRDAVLADSEKQAICDWTKTETAKLDAAP